MQTFLKHTPTDLVLKIIFFGEISCTNITQFLFCQHSSFPGFLSNSDPIVFCLLTTVHLLCLRGTGSSGKWHRHFLPHFPAVIIWKRTVSNIHTGNNLSDANHAATKLDCCLRIVWREENEDHGATMLPMTVNITSTPTFSNKLLKSRATQQYVSRTHVCFS